jgi:microsomal dipeptidase-like Zn-dependent dipeptidase
MMDRMEREINREPDKAELALSAADVKRIRATGKIAVVHTVEGAHVLEGNPDNLDRLAQRGVAMLTLCHFYPNGIATHVNGVPRTFFINKTCSFMSYWLDSADPDDGLPTIWATIEHIHEVTNSWDHIVLGSDFDGFTDPPDDVKDASKLGAVTRMLLERGLTESEVKKILGENAQRLLETGWP